jgi:predicted amidohydrolase YtcJ
MCIACGPVMGALNNSMLNSSRRSFLKHGASAAVAVGGFGGLASRFICSEVLAQTAAGDTLYTGGPIITMTDANPTAEAVLVRAGRIVAVGNHLDVEKQAQAPVSTINLSGKALLPGFFDAHGHAVMVGLQALSANLLPAPDGEGNDIAALQRILREWIAKNTGVIDRYKLIIGFGYDDSQLKEQRHPTRDDLDVVSKDVPILIIHQSGHLGVGNSKALELAMITADTRNPAGGVFRRRQGRDEPNGVAEEYAFFQMIGALLGRLDEPAFLAMVKAGTEFYTRFGYTTVQEARATGVTAAILNKAANLGMLAVDVLVYPDILDEPAAITPSMEYKNRLRIGGAKLTIDGSPQGKTAWLTKPYYVPPAGQKSDYVGYPAITKEQAAHAFDLAYAKNWQILTHANGDAAIDLLIDTVRKAEKKHGKGDRRPVLVHGQTTRLDQLPRLKQLGIIPSFFPMHTFYWGDWHRDSVLGPVRAENISPCASARKHGMIFTSHHDAPVANPDSIRVLSATVTRRTRSGDILGPNERVDTQTALKAMTIWAAEQHFEEKTKGSIEVGKLADLVILDRNPLAVDPEKLIEIKVVETIKEGKTIYKSKAA